MFDLVLPWFLVNFAKFLNRIFLRVISGWLLVNSTGQFLDYLTLSWRGSLSYRNQFIDFGPKSIDWFLYDRDLRLERVIEFLVYAITFRFDFVAHHKILCNLSISTWIYHCVKSVQFSSGPYFPSFSPNVGKYGPERPPYLDTFHAVYN